MATATNTPNLETATKKPSEFKSLMLHLLSFVTLGLKTVITYAAPAETLAQVLFPEYAGLEKEAQTKLVQVATLVQSAVLSAQQKYAASKASNETNAAKLADVLQTVEQPALSLLADVKVSADTVRITNAIEATVAILKTNPAPAAA